jgi:hypothetical protein
MAQRRGPPSGHNGFPAQERAQQKPRGGGASSAPAPRPRPARTCGVPISPSTSLRGVSADTLSTTMTSTEPLRTWGRAQVGPEGVGLGGGVWRQGGGEGETREGGGSPQAASHRRRPAGAPSCRPTSSSKMLKAISPWSGCDTSSAPVSMPSFCGARPEGGRGRGGAPPELQSARPCESAGVAAGQTAPPKWNAPPPPRAGQPGAPRGRAPPWRMRGQRRAPRR